MAKRANLMRRARVVRKAFLNVRPLLHPEYIPEIRKAGGYCLRGLNDGEIEVLYMDWSQSVASAFYLPITDESLDDFSQELVRRFSVRG